MNNAQELLLHLFGPGDWIIEKPQYGRQKECYIASSCDSKVFVKFDVPIKSLQRLGDAGFAPRALASGNYQGASYVIQEFFDGEHPDRGWVAAHLSEVARVIRGYHEDEALTAILAEEGVLAYRDCLNQDLDQLEMRVERVERIESNGRLRAQFARLKDKAASFDDVALTPVHNEPNTGNMLVRRDQLMFIDWDEVLLSDPMRDVGVFLWWYVSVPQWQEFFHRYGASLSAQHEAKINWFAARASLVIHLWRIEHGYPDGGFLDDFTAALNGEPNPQLP
jgi:aminoglycoside phosphotransferase (APT) family kinase protein